MACRRRGLCRRPDKLRLNLRLSVAIVVPQIVRAVWIACGDGTVVPAIGVILDLDAPQVPSLATRSDCVPPGLRDAPGVHKGWGVHPERLRH